ITPASELESDITYQLLNGNTKIINDFNMVIFEPSSISSDNQPYPSIELTPLTPQNQLKTIRFWYDDKNIIHQIVITDHFETITTLRFSNIKINELQANDPAALSTILNFTPPPGTEIIRHQ
ncbi:MAG: outer membrane lipoprotein carrier protein LolA, partial [Desulfobulbaceae bacterium]|nr:outer membrane lipoprotein carrier protein LolA [Desulfobulbaceae bacterium]